MDRVDCVVVGAGVVGLAVARALAQQRPETFVLERHSRPGQETTSRNSGVIHSGIYYPPGSLKAELCVRGRVLLYRYASERGIPHDRCGKLIVAHEDQLAGLHRLRERAVANGVHDLTLLSDSEVQRLEPAVRCAAALLSPETGIIDVHELLSSLLADFEQAGGTLVLHSSVEYAQATHDGIVLGVRSAGVETELLAGVLVNAAGLSAVDLLRNLQGYPEQRVPRAYYAKGNYFVCHGIRPFKRLVYPMPSNAGLGIHATLDLDGTTRFGPDVEWIASPHYDVDAARASSFYAAVREYWPAIPDGSLQPGYAGVRPKLVGPDAPPADFRVEFPRDHGVTGLINLLGIESPGLTSSLAIAEMIARRALDH